MAIRKRLAFALTESFLGGAWTREDLTSRAETLFAQKVSRPWLPGLIGQVLAQFPATQPIPTRRRLSEFLLRMQIPKEDRVPGSTRLVRHLPDWPGTMQPASGPPTTWKVPAIVSVAELAGWLGISQGELDWFANRTGWNSKPPREQLGHYRYRWIQKPSGGVRLLETPKPRLKEFQRQILHGILSQVPCHPAAHAFRTGRSIATYVEPHQNQQVVLHIDLCEFFPSIQSSRIHALFRMLGYPERVAGLLTGLCTNATPSSVLEAGIARVHSESTWQRFRSPHLPQGAPASPMLANLCTYGLDRRLSGLAESASARYSRYADDLVFSGDTDFARSLPRWRILIHAIIMDEGFEIRHRKTRTMVAGTRQHVAGIQLNSHSNIPRATFDELKAILHNSLRFGPDSQNRDGHPRFREHLQGRLAYWSMIAPGRIQKLQLIFDQITWPE